MGDFSGGTCEIYLHWLQYMHSAFNIFINAYDMYIYIKHTSIMECMLYMRIYGLNECSKYIHTHAYSVNVCADIHAQI